MKTSEIEVGTKYAVSRHGMEFEALVISTEPQTVTVRDRYNPSRTRETLAKGITVQFNSGREELVKPQQIKSTWADHEVAKAERNEREQSIRDYQDDLIARVAQITGDNYGCGRNFHGQPGFHIDTMTLRKLIEAAESAK